MATVDSMALLEVLHKCGMDGEVDFLREALRVLVQSLMEAEVSGQIGAQKYEHAEKRKTQGNGYRERLWDTRVGTLPLQIPKLREGRTFQACSSRGAAVNGPLCRWFRKRTCTASALVRSTTWSSLWACRA